MANRRFNTQVAQPRKALAKGGKALKAVDKEKNPGLAKLPTKVRNKMGFMKKGGRVKKMGGGMSTARKDMMSGYYKNDMGMKGGKMYKDGGAVKNNEVARRSRRNKQGYKDIMGAANRDRGKDKARQQGYKDRKDESIAMRIRKSRTPRQLKDSRDESYGKFGSKAKKSGKINR